VTTLTTATTLLTDLLAHLHEKITDVFVICCVYLNDDVFEVMICLRR